MIAGAVTLLGLQLLLGSAGLKGRRSVQRYHDKQATQAQTQSLQSERDELAAELDRERASKVFVGADSSAGATRTGSRR